MKKRLVFGLVLALFAAKPAFSQSQMAVVPASLPPFNDLPLLIHDHLTGAGIDLLSVEFLGAAHAVGYFSTGDSAIHLSRGLILTTGLAASNSSQKGADGLGYEFGSTENVVLTTGIKDTNLQKIATGPIFDPTIFWITFRPRGDSIHFRYVFASEEYPEYACSNFNDAFGFFLSGPNPMGGFYAGQNLAMIPGSNLPVSINTIHPANPPNACPPAFSQFFIDNNGGTQQPVYDGFTVPFVAQAAVVPCQTYQMTIALTDVGDYIYDSGVFLEAKSLVGEPNATVDFPAAEAILPEDAAGDTLVLTLAAISPTLLPITVKVVGTAQNGLDYALIDSVFTVSTADTALFFVVQPMLDSLPEGLETVVFRLEGGSCYFKEFTIYLADADSVAGPGADTVLFLAQPVLLDAGLPSNVAREVWAFQNATPMTIFFNALATSSISVSGLPVEFLETLDLLDSVCLDVFHGELEDLDFYLFAPDGKFLELSSDNGGAGNTLQNTCFSPSATASIKGSGDAAPASMAPFSGLFQPEGQWSDLLGAPANGDWKLGLTDDQDGFTGDLTSWRLHFSGKKLGRFSYEWSTGDTTQTISAAAAGLYEVSILNAVGTISRSFLVTDSLASAAKTPFLEAKKAWLAPNPAHGEARVFWKKESRFDRLRIFDLNGRVVFEKAVSENSSGERLDLEGLAEGLLVVELTSKSGQRERLRLLKLP